MTFAEFPKTGSAATMHPHAKDTKLATPRITWQVLINDFIYFVFLQILGMSEDNDLAN